MSKEIDCKFTDDIVCPYCGYTFTDSYELADDETVTCHGDGCEKKFSLETQRSTTYSTSKINCKVKGHAHQFGEPTVDSTTQETCDRWNAEGFLGKRWTPHDTWKRACQACDDADYKSVEPGGPNPWAETAAA